MRVIKGNYIMQNIVPDSSSRICGYTTNCFWAAGLLLYWRGAVVRAVKNTSKQKNLMKNLLKKARYITRTTKRTRRTFIARIMSVWIANMNGPEMRDAKKKYNFCLYSLYIPDGLLQNLMFLRQPLFFVHLHTKTDIIMTNTKVFSLFPLRNLFFCV